MIQHRRGLAAVGAALAADALDYGPLSAFKTAQAIDAVVEAHDPEALRRSRETARARDLVVDKRNTDHATTPLWARLHAHDTEALDRRLMAMAHSVCDDDPHTIAQRRADTLGALAAGGQILACGSRGGIRWLLILDGSRRSVTVSSAESGQRAAAARPATTDSSAGVFRRHHGTSPSNWRNDQARAAGRCGSGMCQ